MIPNETLYKIVESRYTSEEFLEKRGLRQVNPLSMTLFNVMREKMMREIRLPTTRTILNQFIQTMAYSHDVTMTRTKENFKRAVVNVEKGETPK